jgi:succinylglutamic semialdehyde dehydrogenase
MIAGQWKGGLGPALHSLDPATQAPVWTGNAADPDQVGMAVAAARSSFPQWSATDPRERAGMMQRLAEVLQSRADGLAVVISRETGKPLWESRSEVQAMVEKVAVSIEAYAQRRSPGTREIAGGLGATLYRPHGVVAVFGPFNLPGHLPHGHIVPALLAGNTVVFKPSEKTPGVGSAYAKLWLEAGLPAGVVNLVQGGRDVGAALVENPQIDGLFFTGGCAAGLFLAETFARQPQRILALEMGGNNPLVIDAAGDADAAAYHTIVSAYITAGQRCTCARRLIVPIGRDNDAVMDRLVQRITAVTVGPFTQQPEPFMGPLISAAAARTMLETQRELEQRGGRVLVPMRPLGENLLTPGLIDVTPVKDVPDEEHFGPLLQLRRVADFSAAIDAANATRFGLSAGLLSDDRARWDAFVARIRAGVITWNRPTTGASGRLPFGGIGLSGNHRPSGYWAADYCSYPVAVMSSDTLSVPEKRMTGLTWK